MEMKTCKTCGVERKLNDFYSHPEKKRKIGTCKPCRRKYQRKYYKKNRDKILLNSKSYYHKNKVIMQEYNEEWRIKNPERVKEYGRRFYKKRQELKRNSMLIGAMHVNKANRRADRRN
jgi:hypothetical protein